MGNDFDVFRKIDEEFDMSDYNVADDEQNHHSPLDDMDFSGAFDNFNKY